MISIHVAINDVGELVGMARHEYNLKWAVSTPTFHMYVVRCSPELFADALALYNRERNAEALKQLKLCAHSFTYAGQQVP